jgi:hypothetical protein
LAEFNEGGRREPCYAKTEQVLVDHIYQNRFAELENLRDLIFKNLEICSLKLILEK